MDVRQVMLFLYLEKHRDNDAVRHTDRGHGRHSANQTLPTEYAEISPVVLTLAISQIGRASCATYRKGSDPLFPSLTFFKNLPVDAEVRIAGMMV